MYVLIIANGYPTIGNRGLGIFELDQAKALKAIGCKVVYAAIDVRSVRRRRKWGYEERTIDGVEIHAVNIPGGKIYPALLNRMRVAGLGYLYRRISAKHGHPDILHAHFTHQGYATLDLKEETGIPLVVTEHSSQVNKPNIEPKLFNVAREVYNNADKVVAVSPALASNIEKQFGITPVYIPNIVDVDTFKYQPRSNADGKLRMVSTGNLIHTKRMDLTIEAFSRAFNSEPNASLTIFGDGPERKALEEQIARLNMGGQIRLMGARPRSEIADQLSNSDCFVLASESETFGVAYIEALASGVPVIATRCGGPEAFVTEKNGVMVDVNNLEQLTEAMLYMREHIESYDRIEISRGARNEFAPDKVARKIRDLYESL